MIIVAMAKFSFKWHDNSIANIASDHFIQEPVRKVNRQVRGKGKIEVTQPNMINLYNKGMGGVDFMDHLLGSYRPMIRQKVVLAIDDQSCEYSLVAAWRFYCA